MTTPVIGQLYRETHSGMVVVAVARSNHENSRSRFPGRILFPGKSASWSLVGRRLSTLAVRNFEPLNQGPTPLQGGAL